MLKAHFILWFDMNGPIDAYMCGFAGRLMSPGDDFEVSKAQVRVIFSQSVDQDVALS